MEEDKRCKALPGRTHACLRPASQMPFVCLGGMNEPTPGFLKGHTYREGNAAFLSQAVSMETFRAKQKLIM